ncbi:hypothetical protein [Streptomyces sp. NPDC005148]
MNSTMAARARQTVDDADGAAYADAVSEYAAPGVGRTAGAAAGKLPTGPSPATSGRG